MNQAYFRFYAELNDFLSPERKQVTFVHQFKDRASIKDMLEALGVPHTEIDLILVKGQSVDFSYLVQDGDWISVYPVFASIDITPLVRLRPQPLRPARFVVDVHLGKLATYLRLLGFDTLYRHDCQDRELARISSQEERILLTCDRGLLKRRIVQNGYCVRARNNAQKQLVEVLRRFDLWQQIQPFQRCLRCNGRLHPIEKEAISDRLLPHTQQYHHEFRLCQDCQQIYWKGSHYERLQQFLAHLLQQNN